MHKVVVLGARKSGIDLLMEYMKQIPMITLSHEILSNIAVDHINTETCNYLSYHHGFNLEEYYRKCIEVGQNKNDILIPDQFMKNMYSERYLNYMMNKFDVCKIYYDQFNLLNVNHRSLFKQNDECIIHIVRKDLFSQIVETEYGNNIKRYNPILINENWLELQFAICKSTEEFINYFYVNTVNICYEDFLCDYNYVMNKILVFLKIPSIKIQEKNIKYNKFSIKTLVNNYKELVKYFNCTLFYKYLQHE